MLRSMNSPPHRPPFAAWFASCGHNLRDQHLLILDAVAPVRAKKTEVNTRFIGHLVVEKHLVHETVTLFKTTYIITVNYKL